MAYIDNSVIDEEKKKLKPGEEDNNVSGNLITQQAGTGVATGSTSSGETKQDKGPDSDIATFQRVRDLNQDQATQLANNLATSNFNKQKTKLDTEANEINSNFNNQVTQNTNNLDDNIKGFITDVYKRPGSLSADEVSKFNKVKSGYSGPTEVDQQEVSRFNSDAQLGKEELDTLDTEQGRKAALLNLYKENSPNGILPNQGQTAFDSMLLNAPNIGGIFDETQDKFNRETTAAADNIKNKAAQDVAAAQQKSNESKAFLEQGFNATNQAFKDKINAQVEAEKTAENNKQKNIQDFITSLKGEKIVGDKPVPVPTAESFADKQDLLAQLGITGQQAADLINSQTKGTLIDPSKYLSIENPNLNVNSVINDEDRNYYNALQGLYGSNENFIGNDEERGGKTSFDYNSAKSLADVLPDYSNVSPAGLDSSGNKVPGFDHYVRGIAEKNKNERSDERTSALTGAAQGAATGAKLGSVVPVIGTVAGAIVGAVIGFVANGGLNVVKNDFEKTTNSISKSIGLGEVFGGDTAGTKNYKAYKNAPEEVPGRSFTSDQYGGTRFNVYKENKNSQVMQALAKTFGTGGDFGKKDQNIQMQQAVDSYMTQALKDLQTEGKLPLDNATLETIDGSKVFNLLVVPKLNELIKQKTGISDAFKVNAGVVEKFMADQMDYILYNNFIKSPQTAAQAPIPQASQTNATNLANRISPASRFQAY